MKKTWKSMMAVVLAVVLCANLSAISGVSAAPYETGVQGAEISGGGYKSICNR